MTGPDAVHAKTRSSKTEQAVAIAMFLGVWALAEVLTWNRTQSQAALQHRGVQVSATIIGKTIGGGKGPHYDLAYQYTTNPGAQMLRAGEYVYQDDYDRTRIGDVVPVVYDPKNPGSVRLNWHGEAEGGHAIALFLVLSVLWTLMGGVAFGLMWLSAL